VSYLEAVLDEKKVLLADAVMLRRLLREDGQRAA
jgi:hypothetical protein